MKNISKLSPFFLLLNLFCISGLYAQNEVCSGNFGENIFETGDFGSGNANILTTDPNIAPGYIYTTNPPPSDGYYMITHHSGYWSNNYGSWLNISDNSGTSDGYMMVVNASYTPGIFYEQLVEGLCENTVYAFSADVLNMIRTNATGHIKPNVSFLLDDVVEYSTGEIPQNEKWNTYGFTFSTAPGQTSLKLSLRNNAPGGYGNDLALDNITFRACGPEALILPVNIANICEDGEPKVLEATVVGTDYETPHYQWQQSFDEGNTWQSIPGETNITYTHTDLSSGFYYYRYLLANSAENLANSKCRVFSNVKVVNVVPKFHTVTDTICDGLRYLTGNSAYTQSGVYVDSLISSIGCDSIVTLNLTVAPDNGIAVDFQYQGPSCFAYTDATVNISSIDQVYEPYVVYLNGNPPNTGLNFTGLASGSYLLEVRDHFGCFFQEQIDIAEPSPFVIDLGPDIELDLGEPFKFEIQSSHNISSFEFQSSEVLPCGDDCLKEEWYPTHTQSFQLTAISERGCIAKDSMNIMVENVKKVYFPSAFSPNNDGINDYFTVFASEPNVQQIKRLIIANRWGDIVFEAKEFAPNIDSNGWNGKFKGKMLDVGVYAYMAEVLFLDGTVELFSGDVWLAK